MAARVVLGTQASFSKFDIAGSYFCMLQKWQRTVGAANMLEEEVLLTCELFDVPEGLAPCMTGCGRF